MDPCVPGTSLEDARASARAKLGVPAKYAAKMSVNSICTAFKACKKTNIMPPMDYRRFEGKVYLIDPKSPLSIEDFMMVLGPGQLSDVQRIAKKLGLMTNGPSKSELKSNIIKILQTLNISEPVEIPSQTVKKVISENLGNGSNYNVSPVPSNNVTPSPTNNYNTNPVANYGNSLSPETGETPYSNEVAPNYFKLKTHPTKVSISSPNYFNRYNSPNYFNFNRYTYPKTKVEKPDQSKVNITPVTQQQINNDVRRIQRLRNMVGTEN